LSVWDIVNWDYAINEEANRTPWVKYASTTWISDVTSSKTIRLGFHERRSKLENTGGLGVETTHNMLPWGMMVIFIYNYKIIKRYDILLHYDNYQNDSGSKISI